MVIVETSVFTRRITSIMSDEEYGQFQRFLSEHPDAGAIIPGSGGLRKIRWAIKGKGKGGGARLIYFWARPNNVVLMLFVFKKNERSDLSREQLKQLRIIVETEMP